MSYNKITVIGAGGWGSALAILLAGKGNEVTLWAYLAEQAEEIRTRHTNDAVLPGVEFPHLITPTNALADATDADLVVFVTPSMAVRATAELLAKEGLRKDAVILSCTKGIERGSGLRMTEILQEVFPDNPVAALSGPSHAEEVARGVPAAVVIGARDDKTAQNLQKLFSTPTFRTYTSDDIVGIELGGALKNVFAIAAGVGDGLGLGDNTKAALVTRALAELGRLGLAMGGRPETFQGLSGIGDLMVTCFSAHSRNRGTGEKLGNGMKLADISGATQMVAEGVPTALSAYECARKFGIDSPIIDQTHAILYEDQSPARALHELLNRDLRPENDPTLG